MTKKRKIVDPIPASFDSYDQAANFWDTHDITDYPDEFTPIEIETEFHGRRYELEVDEDVMSALRKRAKQQRVSVSDLASTLLRERV